MVIIYTDLSLTVKIGSLGFVNPSTGGKTEVSTGCSLLARASFLYTAIGCAHKAQLIMVVPLAAASDFKDGAGQDAKVLVMSA